MPNISGEYTLAEAALKLGVSPAWIGKVRKLTGIGGSLGTQGKKSAFIDKDLAELETVRLYRAIYLDYADIKHLYEMEEELLILNKNVKQPNGMAISLYIHAGKEEKIFSINSKANREDLTEYTQKLIKYIEITKSIDEKIKKLQENIGSIQKQQAQLKLALRKDKK